MHIHKLSAPEWGKAIAVGVAVSVLTGAVMFLGLKSGISPLPKPLALAFATTLLDMKLPLPVGLLFHAAWVTFFSVVYVLLFRDALTFMRAFWLAFVLWALVLAVIFPAVGWGFFGLAVTPKLIIAAAVSHLLFAVLLWAFSKFAFSSHPDRVERGS